MTKIICVDASGLETLKEGEVYTIQSEDFDYVMVNDNWFAAYRFHSFSDEEEVLLEL